MKKTCVFPLPESFWAHYLCPLSAPSCCHILGPGPRPLGSPPHSSPPACWWFHRWRAERRKEIVSTTQMWSTPTNLWLHSTMVVPKQSLLQAAAVSRSAQTVHHAAVTYMRKNVSSWLDHHPTVAPDSWFSASWHKGFKIWRKTQYVMCSECN